MTRSWLGTTCSTAIIVGCWLASRTPATAAPSAQTVTGPHGWTVSTVSPASDYIQFMPFRFVRSGHRILIVASFRNEAGSFGQTLWLSSDLRQWQTLAPSAGLALNVADAAPWQGGFVAVGSVPPAAGTQRLIPPTPAPGAPPRVAYPAISLSGDGLHWRSVRTLRAYPDAGLGRVVATPHGLAALGEHANQFADVWLSSDARHWQRTFSYAGSPLRTIFDAIADSNNRLVVAGSFVGTDNRARPAVWLSKDGRRWTHETLLVPLGLMATGVSTLAVQGLNVVATDSVQDSTPAAPVWISHDGGLHWQVTTGLPNHDLTVADITPYKGSFVAIGGFDRRPALWWLQNGRRWIQLAGADAFAGITRSVPPNAATGRVDLDLVLSDGDRLLILGVRELPNSPGGAVTVWEHKGLPAG